MSAESDFLASLALLDSDSILWNQIVNGDDQTDVATENGIVPSVAKFFRLIKFDAGKASAGGWDASANVPDLSSINPGGLEFYTVSVAGTNSLTGTSENWELGDQALYIDGTWYRKVRFTGFGTNAVYATQTLRDSTVPNYPGELEITLSELNSEEPLSAVSFATSPALGDRTENLQTLMDQRYPLAKNTAALTDLKYNTHASLIVGAGQSKTQGRKSIVDVDYLEDDLPLPNQKQIYRGFSSPNYAAPLGSGAFTSFVPATQPLQWFQKSVVELADKETSSFFATGREIAGSSGARDVIHVPCAWGATGTAENEWRVGSRLYLDTVADMRNAERLAKKVYDTVDWRAFIWNHGEDDSYSQSAADNVEAYLVAMFADLRSRFPSLGPIIIHGLVPEFITARGNPGLTVDAALRNLPNLVTNCHFIDSSDLSGNTPDNIHWNAYASRLDGKRAGEKINELSPFVLPERSTTEPSLVFELGEEGGVAVDKANGNEVIPVRGSSPYVETGTGRVYFPSNGCYRPVQAYPQGSWTTQAFFRLPRLSFNQNMFSGFNSGGAGQVPGESGQVHFILGSSNTLQISNNQGAYPELQIGAPTELGVWHKYRVTYDAETLEMKLWLNGNLVDTASNVAPRTVGSSRMMLGGFDSSNYANLELDGCKVWDGVVTEEDPLGVWQSEALVLNGDPNNLPLLADLSPIVSCGFNGDFTDDSVNGNDGTQIGTGAVFNVNTVMLNGSQEVDFGDILPLVGAWTKRIRFKTSTTGTTMDLLSGDTTSAANIRISSGGTLQARAKSTLPFPRVSGGPVVTDGNWHEALHVFRPYGANGTSELWLDGVCIKIAADGAANDANVRLGGLNNSARFVGEISEIGIYPSALSPEKLKQFTI